MNKHVLTLLVLALILAIASACDSTNLAVSNATAVPSRTPRPTFTPRPSATTEAADTATVQATSQATAAAAPTDTPAMAEATNTTAAPAKPTNTKAPPKPVQPTAVPATAKPQFGIVPGTFSPSGESRYQCENESPVYEIIMNAKKVGTPPRPYVADLWFGVFQGGQLLTDYGGKKLIASTDDGRASSGYAWGSNCKKSSDSLNPDRYNGKLDVFDIIKGGTKTMTVRFVRSQTDLTPISGDVTVDFTKSGAWWLYFDVR